MYFPAAASKKIEFSFRKSVEKLTVANTDDTDHCSCDADCSSNAAQDQCNDGKCSHLLASTSKTKCLPDIQYYTLKLSKRKNKLH